MLYLIYCIQQNAAPETSVPVKDGGSPSQVTPVEAKNKAKINTNKRNIDVNNAEVSSTSALLYISYLDNSCCI